MKVEITKRQLQAIAEISSTLDAMIGCSEPNDITGSYFDKDTQKELKLIQRFFNKNGYELDLS